MVYYLHGFASPKVHSFCQDWIFIHKIYTFVKTVTNSFMKKNLFVFSLALLGLMIAFSSCKKSTPKSKTELISRTWKAQKVESKSNGASTATVVFQEGASGNTASGYAGYRLSFNKTGFTLVDDNQVNSSGTWTFDTNETNINFTVPSNANFKPASVAVITLSETALTIRYTEVNPKGQSSERTIYLVPAG